MKLRRNHFLSTWTFFFLHVSIEKFLGKKWVYLTIFTETAVLLNQ